MYHSKLSIKETHKAIEEIKSNFSTIFSKKLNLIKITAPLFVEPSTGLNDGLNGEKPVSFAIKNLHKKLEIVHSLAKWKRVALKRYNFEIGEGLYTYMNAIRREEIPSQHHSFYVDQWDWEKVILKSQRTEAFLEENVKKIYMAIQETEKLIIEKYPKLKIKLPKELVFISSQQLEDLYPTLSPEKRELEFARKHHAFFVKQVGAKLKSGVVHSSRAYDYDDWKLNGDLIVYDAINDKALELSSMGIRVDSLSLISQSQKTLEELIQLSPFHKSVIEETIPFSIGGGIGQSRLCMFLLEKAHIAEVQSSFWGEEIERALAKANIPIM